MHIVLGLIGIACSVMLIVYRESVGDMLGEPLWAEKVGGIYNVVVIFAVLLFFWSIAYMTGTLDIFLSPLLRLFPHRQAAGTGIPGTEF